MTQLQEFVQVFGQRFVGLVDNLNMYSVYRVPIPEAPYPQDYIIDQQGNVAYWSDQYDPQEIIRVIDRLLGSNVKESEIHGSGSRNLKLDVVPNPVAGNVCITYSVERAAEGATVGIYDVSGKLVFEFVPIAWNALSRTLTWSTVDRAGRKVSAGVYHVRLTAGQDVISRNIVVTK